MAFYIFEFDPLGLGILKQLRDRASQGVRVQILVDGFGAPHWTPQWIQSLSEAGIESQAYHPLGSWRLHTLNRRMHCKIATIDQKIAWVGSFNIAQNSWRDTALRVTGPDVAHLVDGFNRLWNAKPLIRSAPPCSGVLLNFGTLERRRHRIFFLKLLGSASRRAWIATPYFNPSYSHLRAIKRACQRGVDVRILLPDAPDVFFMSWINRVFYSELLLCGTRIYEYLPQIFHAKTWLIDQIGVVGSSNFNHRSLLHDLEADVVLTDPTSIQTLEQHYQQDLRQAKEVKLNRFPVYNRLARILGRLLLVFKIWI